MPIPIACDCGRSMRVKEEYAGRKIRCPGCASVLTVPKPEADGDGEDEALNLLREDDGAKPSRRPAPADTGDEEQVQSSPAPRRPPPRPAPAKDWAPKVRKVRTGSVRKRSEGGGFGIAVNPEIITGLLMIAGAAVWFFVGLAMGWIFFYPIFLVVAGFLAIGRGFTKGG